MFSKLIGSERAELESKSIQYLRKLADAIGVDSPTLMGKKELIDEILVVLMGGRPDKKKETRGRPKKNFRPQVFGEELSEDENSIVVEYDYAVPRGLGVGVFSSGAGDEDSLREKRNQVYERYIEYYERKLRENEQKIKECRDTSSWFSDDIKKYITAGVDELLSDSSYELNYGYVYIKNNKIYILKSGFDINNKIEVTDFSIVGKSCLRVGDEVHYYLSDNNFPVVLMVNGIDVDELEHRKNFENLAIGYPCEKIESINIINKVAPIAFGSRNILRGNYDNATFIGAGLLNGISKFEKETYIYAIGIDLKGGYLSKLQCATDVVLNLNVSNDKKIELTKIKVFRERIKRLAELGYDVVLYIDNCSLIKKFLLDSGSNALLGEMFSLGSKFKELGSITTIATGICSKQDKEFDDLMTNQICISNSEDEGDGSLILVEECKTLFTDRFLTVGELEEMENLKLGWKNLSVSEKNKINNKYE